MRTQITTTLTQMVRDLDPVRSVLNTACQEQWEKDLIQINAELFRTMSALTMGFLDNKLVSRHLCQMQRECIGLLDTLYHYREVPLSLTGLFKLLYDALTEILDHLRCWYFKYLNNDTLLPLRHFEVAVTVMKDEVLQLKAMFRKGGVPKELKDLVLNSMDQFLDAGCCSYHQLLYMQKLIEVMIRLCGDTQSAQLPGRIQDELLSLNFNTADHVRYYKGNMALILGELYDVDQKYELLCEYERFFNPRRERKGLYFEKKNRSVRAVMLAYVQAEMNFMEKQRQVRYAKKAQATEAPLVQDTDYRVKVSLSVDVLAYLLKLLVAAGVVLGSKTQFFLFISKHVQTPGKGDGTISPNSLGTKSKQVVQTTAKNLRALLMRMVKIIDGEFDFEV